jgi:hypothetical protein
LNYRQIAESSRVCKVLPRDKSKIIKNLLLACPLNQWKIAYLCHAPSSKHRLSDEDLREIYFLLTDLYPEEVSENPNPITMLADLSRANKTVAIVDRAFEVTKSVLESCEDNIQRSALLRPLFSRITSQDLMCFFLRLSNRQGPINRYDVTKALAHANGELMRHVRKASFLIGLEKTCDRLSRQESIHDVLKPAIGMPMIIPSPSICNIRDVPFGKTLLEIPEGERMTLHILKDDVRIYNTTGTLLDIEDSTLQMIESAGIKGGIYLVEYASGRDIEMMIVDLLTPSIETMPFEKRRKMIGCKDWALKPMVEIEDAAYYLEHVGTKQPVILWNANGILTHESSVYETVLMNIHQVHKSVFMVIGGLYVKENPQSRPVLSKWRIAVRDGDSHYPVGLVDIVPNLSLMRFTNPHKIVEGEEVSMKSPVFVNVKVISSGWGDYGAYIQGVIESVASSAGLNDCVGIDEIEALTKRWDEEYGDAN